LIWRGLRLAWMAAARELSLVLVLQLVSAAGLLVQLLLGRSILNAIVNHRTSGGLAHLTPTLIGLAVVTAAVAVSATVLNERQRVLAALVDRHVQDRILDVVAEVPLPDFENPDFHDRLRRATTNASERSWQVSIAIVSFFSAAAALVPLAVVLVRIEPLVLPAVVIAYAPLHIATTRNGRAAYDFNFWMTTTDRERAYLGEVLLGPSAAKELRLFGSTGWLRSRYDSLYDRRIAELRRLTRRRTQRSLVATAWSTIVTMAGVVVLVHWALDGRLTPAAAGIAAVAVQQIGTRMRGLGSSAGSLHECGLFLDDVITFLSVPPESDRHGVSVAAVPERVSCLRVEHVSFTYPGMGQPVLHDVSIEIGSDEIVALVGANGSGKTTLAKLLCGLYTPTAGRVLWDDTDVADCEPAAIRRRVAAAFQDFVRYELSGAHNVGLGDVTKIDDPDAIRQAAASAGADELLSGLPHGYATRLSRAYADGVDLSIGEWQRVAVARAFLRDAPFLVLDEPTAALDPHAERELFDAMRALHCRRAVLLISHRFSSVRAADRIYVLDHGRVIESGTHDALMARGSRYAEMFTLQAGAFLDVGSAPIADPPVVPKSRGR
jgi:ATP-binding cassette subfamily B protein